ncbi:MAG: hypothetical protein ACODAE_08715 [Gemmatimonadota bacterium]
MNQGMRPPRTRAAARATKVAASALGVLVAAASACSDGYPTGPDADELVIHGMLIVGAPVQEVLVERARAIDEGFLRAPTGVEDATVTVERPGGGHGP